MARPDVDGLLDYIYGAALDEGEGPKFLDRLMSTFGGAAAVLYSRDDFAKSGPIEIGSIVGYTQGQIENFTSHYRHLDVRAQRAIAADPGLVYVDDRDLSFADLARGSLHNEFYRPAGVGHISGILLEKQPGRLTIMSLHRSIGNGAFSADEVALLDLLAPHLVRAWTLRRRLLDAKATAAGASLALDHFAMPVFMVDANLQLKMLNAAADALVRTHGPLRVRGRQVQASPLANDNALRHAVRDALAGNPPPLLHLKADGFTPISIFIAADPAARRGAGGLALIFASNRAQMQRVAADMLVREFGLTAAEARTAAALTDGTAPLEIASQFGISVETVRTQLKQAMLKCDARGLVQLATRVMASLAALRRP